MLLLSILLVSLTLGHISCFKAAPGRVIGGQDAADGQFPYQVSLQKRGRHACGGSIISSTWILTAAHCVVGKNPADLRAVVGLTDLQSGKGRQLGVSQLVSHPKYDKATNDWDIGLVKLNRPIAFSTSVQKIDLAPVNASFAFNTIVTVSGFGAINKNLDTTTKLQYANIPLWENSLCAQVAPITDRMVCGGYANGQLKSCQGDSGGPVTLNGTLFGVVSWGFGCGLPRPSVFAYVAAFRDWIKQNSGV